MPAFGFSSTPHSSMPTSSGSLFAPQFFSTHHPPPVDPAILPPPSSFFMPPYDQAHSLHPAYATSGVDASVPWRPSVMPGPSCYAYKGSDWFLPSVPVDVWNHLDADCSKPISSSSSPSYSSSSPFSVQQDTSLAHHVSISSSVFAQLDTSSPRNWISASGYLNRDLASKTTISPLVHVRCSKIGDDADKISCGVGLSRSQLPAQQKKGLGRMSGLETDETCISNHNQNFTDSFSEPYLAEKQRLEGLQHTPGAAPAFAC